VLVMIPKRNLDIFEARGLPLMDDPRNWVENHPVSELGITLNNIADLMLFFVPTKPFRYDCKSCHSCGRTFFGHKLLHTICRECHSGGHHQAVVATRRSF
jgi:hypothetical protein